MTAPRPRPQSRTAGSADPEPVDPEPVASERSETDDSRLGRRRAERCAERRARRDVVRLGLFGVCVLGLVAALVLLLVGGTGAAGPARSGVPRAGSTTDAELADADLANAFIAGATSDLPAVTSFDYRSLDDALSAGSSVSTGAFRAAFRSALTGDLATAARRDRTVQNFDLLKAGIGYQSADGASAVVLAFGTETVIEGDRTTTNPVTLTATMQRQGGAFLISKLEVGTNPGLPPGTQALVSAAEAGREGVLARVAQPGVDAAVSAIAVERAGGDTVVLLVAATGTRTGATGTATAVTDGRYEVTVMRGDAGWRIVEVAPVGAA